LYGALYDVGFFFILCVLHDLGVFLMMLGVHDFLCLKPVFL
jgi:hypothetical protein